MALNHNQTRENTMTEIGVPSYLQAMRSDITLTKTHKVPTTVLQITAAQRNDLHTQARALYQTFSNDQTFAKAMKVEGVIARKLKANASEKEAWRLAQENLNYELSSHTNFDAFQKLLASLSGDVAAMFSAQYLLFDTACRQISLEPDTINVRDTVDTIMFALLKSKSGLLSVTNLLPQLTRFHAYVDSSEFKYDKASKLRHILHALERTAGMWRVFIATDHTVYIKKTDEMLSLPDSLINKVTVSTGMILPQFIPVTPKTIGHKYGSANAVFATQQYSADIQASSNSIPYTIDPFIVALPYEPPTHNKLNVELSEYERQVLADTHARKVSTLLKLEEQDLDIFVSHHPDSRGRQYHLLQDSHVWHGIMSPKAYASSPESYNTVLDNLDNL